MSQVHNNVLISFALQKWYEINKRDLPWRKTKDPYIIWISEIILQQTRVNQGYDYFIRFIKRFPDVESLASATEEEVLKIWQGLGYYSRARNLHTASKQIVTEYKGEFPKSYHDILSLKGVGDYTAAAIASIAFDLPFAVVDGNVNRVISRLFRVDGKKEITVFAQLILDQKNPSTHNQALMELGALTCTPQNPLCHNCPLANFCEAYINNEVLKYPTKKESQKIRNRYFNYFHIVYGDNTFIRKRRAKDIWLNLYEFPLIETTEQTSIIEITENMQYMKLFGLLSHIELIQIHSMKHILTHQIIFATFYKIKIPTTEKFAISNDFLSIKEEDIDKYPISRLIHKYLEKCQE
ncbi:MAG: A/G-specific adenine glycosylase [Dysgonamonadaceae bacterium]|jgi:A/G-specific adenine glycosylase|nr:A/G-specific adenine glycosylase [Dysgonamonadaceae bacterium]MDD3899820.1 A/G-specific adenine glycosylase [Dysgonamonadaceae bacterium]MDD4398610.1 A/G-specific adenine glycosylase [Dysgonamonadaceae bacterium]MEA5081325.1 A/G-specific adenine glycosylase [Dysgonamonadaceae bacterium]